MNLKRNALYLIVSLWFVGILASLVYMSISSVTAFDPDNQLLRQTSSQEYDLVFAHQLEKQLTNIDNTVLHFVEEGCRCNSTAEEHINSVYQLARQNHFKNRTIDINAITFIQQDDYLPIIPSTPAIAVFGDAGKLIYFGPYSAGYSCSVGNGIVESFISSQSNKMPGAAIVADTLGCYCNRT